ncbi:MAG: type II and III secretion system protein [Terriglobales bacterium]
MRWLPAGSVLLFAGVCLAADTPPAAAPTLCSNSAGAPACHGPAKDLKAARQAFARGLKLEKSRNENLQNLDEAFYEFEEASRLVPQNVEYVTAREITRQHLAGMHLERGNSDLLDGRQVEALAEFRTALNLDPQNEFAQQRISDALGPVPVHTASPPQMIASADALVAKPIDGRHDVHYRGDSRGLLTAVAASYGLTVVFDENFPSRRVRFDIENADFATAMRAASAATKSFSVPLEDTVLFACADTPDNHRFYDRMGMRSFYIPGGSAAQELNELMNSLRTLFEFKFASLNAASSMITLRGPQAALEAATQFLGQMNSTRPEVMLDLKVFQVSHTYARNIGLHVPDQFNLFNIPAAALVALGGQNIQTLINQLIASGGINQAGNQTIAALLAQLQGQQNSIFSQPLATFGGGLTLMGLSLDRLSAALSMNESSVRSLDHVHLRASQEKEATFKLGSRYPILNASFAPIYNSSAISQVLGNQSYAAAFPSVSYEDIGLTLKAKPLVHNNSDVALELEIQFRTLGATNSNGIPIISNREYKGGILLKEGEPAVVAGMITETDQKSLSGLPALSRVPGLGVLTSQSSKQEEDDELLILITPYVVRSPERTEAPEIWMGK